MAIQVCLCPLSLAAKLNFNTSNVVYNTEMYWICSHPGTNVLTREFVLIPRARVVGLAKWY